MGGVHCTCAHALPRFAVWLTYEAMGMDRHKDFLPPPNQAKNKAVLENGPEALKIAQEGGVTIGPDSDLLRPLHVEKSKEFETRKGVLSDGEVLIRPRRIQPL
jgi:hypothetical protein